MEPKHFKKKRYVKLRFVVRGDTDGWHGGGAVQQTGNL